MNDSTGAILGLSTAVLFVIVYVWYALALSAMFAKTGEPSWKAWVPVVNLATILKLGGFSPWLVLLNLVPLFGGIAFVIVFIVAVHRISVGFDRGAGTTVLGVLVQVVWASVLGFGSARWYGHEAIRSSAIDENSAPSRRGQDFAGPYVPLVGGWTPEPPATATDDDSPRSEPVVLPFAAPSGSLSDAVPSAVDWAPSRRDDEAPLSERPAAPRAQDRAPDAAPPTSVFDVLDALRADASEPASRRSTADAAPASSDPDDNGFQPTVPLTPGLPFRGRGAAAVPPAPTESEVEPAPRAAQTFPQPEPWAPPRRAEDVDTPAADSPLTRPAPEASPESESPASDAEAIPDEFPELSEAVSAVSGAPDAGAPRSARTSVAALYTQPEFAADPVGDDDLDALDRTVVARRRRIPWALVPPSGDPIDLTSSVVIVGRRPAADIAFPDAQLVAIADETRTVSKTHARLQLRGDTWFVTDLDSTNGVLFATLMGTEIEAPPGEEIEAGERFFLGDAEVRLSRRDA
ncbi:DUF5684 domain-containing protein [Microbacterium testaceum]|uniref:DUF5684 domain-containing protein n=1 Tax=Microbacterium testaceum TaxID=2033 RepID=UPI000733C9EB|nr:DUF5684 domain-containing protein [Microbacterium testaceum]